MRYADRLEQELREAVRREEAVRRRGPAWARRPAMRAALLPAAGLLAAAVIAAIGVSEGPRDERAASPPRLFGTYAARAMGDEFRVVLVPGGFLIDGEAIHINGALEVDGSHLRFVRPDENALPPAVGGEHISSLGLPRYLSPLEERGCTLARSATYRWTVTADALRLEPVRDPCRARRDYLGAGALRRVGS